MRNAPGLRKARPVSAAERLEWARGALEDAAHRLTLSAHDELLRLAVVSRSRELTGLRAEMQRWEESERKRKAAANRRVGHAKRAREQRLAAAGSAPTPAEVPANG